MSLANKFNIPPALFETIKKMNEGKAEYQAKVKALMAKMGIKSIGELSPEEKKKFFNTLDLMHKAKNEEVELEEAKSGTGYDLYHKDFSSAMQHAYDFAKKKYGIEIDPTEIDRNVAMGPRKPGSGKANAYRLLDKTGKKAIQVQVANLDNKRYELNMYKEDVDLEEEQKYYSIVHKTTKKVLSTHKNLDSAKDEHRGMDQGVRAHYYIATSTKEPKTFNMKEDVDLEEETQTYMVKFEKNGKVSLKNYEAKSDLDARLKAKVDAKRMGMNVSSVRLKEEVELDEVLDTPSKTLGYLAKATVSGLKSGALGTGKFRKRQAGIRTAVRKTKEKIANEEVEQIEEGMSASQIKKLRDAYGNIDKIDVSGQPYKNLVAFLDKQNLDTLKMLAGAKIKFISPLAQNRVVRKMNESIGSTVGRALGQYAGSKMGLEGPGGEHGAALGRQLEMYARAILKKLTKEEIELEEAKEVMVCKDCGDEFDKPTTDCPHDSHDPNGKNWIKKEMNEEVEELDEIRAETAKSVAQKRDLHFRKGTPTETQKRRMGRGDWRADPQLHADKARQSAEKRGAKDVYDYNKKEEVEFDEASNPQVSMKRAGLSVDRAKEVMRHQKEIGTIRKKREALRNSYDPSIIEAYKKMKNKKNEVTKDDNQIVKSSDKLSGKQEPIELEPELKEQKS